MQHCGRRRSLDVVVTNFLGGFGVNPLKGRLVLARKRLEFCNESIFVSKIQGDFVKENDQKEKE